MLMLIALLHITFRFRRYAADVVEPYAAWRFA